MQAWSSSAQYQKVAEANRRWYAKDAHYYETTETCVNNPGVQQYLERTLEEVLAQFKRPAQELQILDACGGTGNVALKLLKRGLNVTLADISKELIEIFESKCAREGCHGRAVCTEIASFLTQNPGRFDLIVFSSALHHLENVTAVLKLALGALRPGGMVFTIHDPTASARRKLLARVALGAEYVVFRCVDRSADFPAAIKRRVKRILARVSAQRRQEMPINDATLGVLAEYHAVRGIDDLQLVSDLQGQFAVVWHKRRSGGRYPLTRKVLESLQEKTEFELLLRKPA